VREAAVEPGLVAAIAGVGDEPGGPISVPLEELGERRARGFNAVFRD
jgi:hypothetical protein